MENDVIIRTENLSYVYRDNDIEDALKVESPALKNINLEIKRGEYVAVLGHNGSGKSTLAKLLNLILVPTEGKLFIDGEDVSSPDLSLESVFEVRKKIGMVFQNPVNQIVATVVEEDVAFGPENLGLPREEIKKRITEALALVGMTEYSRHAPHKLSGGQKQRVAIAGIVAMKPDCIIFDESTAMLDPLGRQDVLEIMEMLNKEEGITVINITHYMEEAARAGRVIVINDGKLVMDGKPSEIFQKVDTLHSIGLEAPQGIELIHLLNSLGMDIDENVLTVEECTDALFAYLIKE